MNWWLVANHLKHGMMTVRPAGMFGTMEDHGADAGARAAPHVVHDAAIEAKPAPRPPVPVMALVSFAALAAGLAIASSFRPYPILWRKSLDIWPRCRCQITI
jgi:hypothetical protein